METMLTHVAGVDVHKEVLTITVITGEESSNCKIETFECKTFTDNLRECAKKLVNLGVKNVAMESTGIYWKPVYNVFIDYGLIITLGNATHMKNVPGRKTDVKDSEWIARLHRNGLIRASYVPEEEFQELRQLTRHRSTLVSDISRLKNRVQKVLEDGNIKLGSVISDVFGVSGYAIIKAIADGETDANKLANFVTTNIKRKEDIKKALTNCLKERHCFLIGELLTQYMYLKELLNRIDKKINNKMKKHSKLIDKLVKIPGIDNNLADIIIAEATTNMDNFDDERKFAAWAGVAPGNNESARKRKRAKSRRGNTKLKKALIQAATGAVKKNESYYKAKYNSLKFRLGCKNKAKVAIANRIARVIYILIKYDNEEYKDIGHLRVDSTEKQINRSIKRLKNLGVKVNYYHHKKYVEAKREITLKN